MSMQFRAVVGVTLAALLASGCASVGGGGRGGVRAATAMPWMKVNGVTLTRTSDEAFRVGKLAGLPLPKDQADARALSGLTAAYVKVAKAALARGDAETFVVARHFASKSAALQAATFGASKVAVATMAQGGMSQVVIPAGGYSMLPAFDRLEGDGKKLAGALPAGYWSMTADASKALGMANQILSGAVQIQGLLTEKPKSALMAMPEGVPYTVRTGDGKTVVVERSKDMLVVHNPGGEAVEVDVEKLGFLPRMLPPSDLRKEAAPILHNMVAVTDHVFINNRAANRVYVSAPNRVTGGDKPVILDENGMIARSPAATARGEAEYQRSPAYRLAVKSIDGNVFNQPERVDFDRQCFGGGGLFGGGDSKLGSSSMLNYQGSYAEIQELQCRDKLHNTVYSKSYFVGGTGKAQTWDSIVKDRKTRKAVDDAIAELDAANTIASVVPLWGNLDSAAACFGQRPLTEQLYRKHNVGLNVVKLASMVDVAREASFSEWALSCGMAVNILGTPIKAAKVVADMGKLSPLMAKKIMDLDRKMSLFDTALMDRKKWSDVAQVLPEGGGKMLAKVTYDTVQQGAQISQLAGVVGSWAVSGS